MIKLLIFDLWGTIIENGVYSPIKQVKNILRINMPFEEYVVRFEKVLMLNNYSDLYEGFKLVCKEFNIRDNPYILNKLVGIWNKNWLLAKPYNNALETVQTLKEKYKTVLIVNADKSINSLIEKYSLEKYFDKIYLSYQTKFLKVNPESFKLIIKDFNVKPEECVMIGDSMGATAALMFADQATCVHAFCPQVDLSVSSIRPAKDAAWAKSLQCRVNAGVNACRGKVTVHVGDWKHDIDQVNMLPQNKLNVKVYGVTSHRLAISLDKSGKLLPMLRAAILHELGLSGKNVRISNLF